MRIADVIVERRSNPELNPKVPFSQQVDAIIKKHGGTINDYWINSSAVDHLGFYGGNKKHPIPWRTRPGQAFDVPTKPFQQQRKYRSAEYATIGTATYSGTGPRNVKYGLWFMPLKAALPSLNDATYTYLRNFVFLVKLKDDAWLQPVDPMGTTRANLIGINPPAGKHKVGQFNRDTNIAVLFEPAFNIVGKWTKQEILNNARREQARQQP